MSRKNLSRRDFIGKTSAGITGAALITPVFAAGAVSCRNSRSQIRSGARGSTEAFSGIARQHLTPEEPYAYHKLLSTAPVHLPRRNPEALPGEGEMVIPAQEWKLVWSPLNSQILENCILDFQDYLSVSQEVSVALAGKSTLSEWEELTRCIVAGTRGQLSGCGMDLKGPKDYEIIVSPDRIVVCGYDDRGVMFGLCDLEARMNLREAPILPSPLQTVRHSLYDTRMVQSWMGWMEWPDRLFSHLVHQGFDAIFASIYANPNGDRTTAETSTDFYARLLFKNRRMDPARMRDLINRAARYGIKVYTPIIYQYTGTPESEAGLRKLVRDIVKEFPDIRGYILLTEGFWYKKWGGGHGASREYMEEWARNWCFAAGIVEEECHRIDPSIEILPWEYNIDFRPQNADMKKFFIRQLPDRCIPLLTWENGKSFEIDGMKGFLRDYSLNQVGPAEVTDAQIGEANSRGMKVYSKVDTFASWQFGTIPYLPCPFQWYERYQALEKFGVKGTLESWSSGYKPNFISEIRAWTCWSNAPATEELLHSVAARIFGKENSAQVVKAWECFSQAIRLVPDTGPNMGTNNAIGNPLFFREPPLRTATFNYSWTDFSNGKGYFGCSLNPYWPFTVSRMVFFPDFSNKSNKAELYARSATGVQVTKDTKVLPVFLKYLRMAAEKMEEGLTLYRTAAENAPEGKRREALREVIVAEQLQRMMQSDHAILEFEDLRLKLSAEKEASVANEILDTMEQILRDETDRTERSLIAANLDSRLGFQYEQDYVYTPYSLTEKLALLKETLEVQIPEARRSKPK